MNKKQGSSWQRVKDSFLSSDLFAQQIGFNIEGKKSLGSVFGALMSICIIAIVLIYGRYKLEDWINFEDTSHYVKTVTDSLDGE